jgi:8-oxo-dGTP diphosphatase
MSAETKVLAAVSVALVRGDRVLLVKRGRAPSKGLYAFPGGRVEQGERPEDAARRELMEETGLAVEALGEVVALDLPAEPGLTAFRLQVFAGVHVAGEPVAGDDADSAAFYTLDELRRLPLTDMIEEVAAAVLSGDVGVPCGGHDSAP